MHASRHDSKLIAQQIMNVLQSCWRTPSLVSCVHDHGADCFPVHRERLEYLISNRKSLQFILPAFPAKSPNLDKTASALPDLGECLALRQLNDLCEQIKRVYPFGVDLKICSDGRVFSDLVRVTDEAVNAYAAGIRQIIKENRLDNISTYSLDDCYRDHSYTARRDQLVKEFGDSLHLLRAKVRTQQSHKLLFNGIHRFIYEDQLPMFEKTSKNQMRKLTKNIAYRVIQRSNAWSNLIEIIFPDAIRLSIHPQTCDAKKMGVMLLRSTDEWATPWHRVVLKAGNSYRLVKRKDAEALGAKAVQENGRFSHYEYV